MSFEGGALVDTRYKTFWRRFGALFVDGLILRPLQIFSPDVEIGSPFSVVVLVTVLSVVTVAYSTLMHAFRGQTLGKMAAGVIVLDLSEKQIPGWWQSLKRDSLNYGFVAASFVLFAMVASMDSELERFGIAAFGFGVLFAWLALTFAEIGSTLTNERRRSIHDLIAGTVVVKTSALTQQQLAEFIGKPREHRRQPPTSAARRDPPGSGW